MYPPSTLGCFFNISGIGLRDPILNVFFRFFKAYEQVYSLKTFLLSFSDFSDIRLKEHGMRMEKVRISGMFGPKCQAMLLMAAQGRLHVIAIISLMGQNIASRLFQ